MANAQSRSVLETLAARQWQEYQTCTPGTYFAEARDPLTLDEAYAVQMEVARLRCAAGDAVVGYKVGCIGSGVVEQFGMSGPIHARLFRSEIRNSGETLQYNAYTNLAIEGEMAVRIGTNGGIEAAFPVIELHHFVFRGPRKTLAELVANQRAQRRRGDLEPPHSSDTRGLDGRPHLVRCRQRRNHRCRSVVGDERWRCRSDRMAPRRPRPLWRLIETWRPRVGRNAAWAESGKTW